MTGDGLRAPAAHAQLHDGRSSLARRSRLYLMVARVAPLQLQRQSFLVENPPYGTHVGLSAEAGAYYVGDLVRVEGRVLGLEVHDEPADVGRELSPFGLLGSEQALHPFVLEVPYPAPQRRLGDASLPGALCYGTAEEHVLWRIRSYSTCSGHQHSGSICWKSSVGSIRGRFLTMRFPPRSNLRHG